MYINQLTVNEQKAIQVKLETAGLNSEQIQDAMDGKLEDVEELICVRFDDQYENEEGDTIYYVCPTCADRLNASKDNPTALGVCFVSGCGNESEFEISDLINAHIAYFQNERLLL
ncbi:hypothetical protein ACH6EH_06840 [Paenibacillus sp. JSM ZJ436]|uniref:hypothetical protein n=1 Tax=Paenibacillus sp. JSM ZJ436 TaxID=3376190 RepID=UPI0037901CBC